MYSTLLNIVWAVCPVRCGNLRTCFTALPHSLTAASHLMLSPLSRLAMLSKESDIYSVVLG
jgi:hypothetical protein